jgi:two-component system chemotaxis response regulator CheB
MSDVRDPLRAPFDAPTRLVVIGGSAGALDALRRVFSALPGGCAAPVVVVMHVPRRRSSGLAGAIGRFVETQVVEVEDKAPLRAHTVHVAPPDYHVLIEHGTPPTLALSVDAPVRFSMPSIDVLFESAADACAPGVLAVVLSGANDDGAAGLAAVVAAGGRGVVQAPDTALVPAMPEAALARTPAAVALAPEAIGAALGRLVTTGAAS